MCNNITNNNVAKNDVTEYLNNEEEKEFFKATQ